MLILLLCSIPTFAGLFDAPGRSQSAPADRASVLDFQQNQHDPSLTRQVKDGHCLYRKQIGIAPSQADTAEVKLPPGIWHEGEFYDKNEIYHKQLTVPITVDQAKPGTILTTTYQGCADAGFCYPSETETVPLGEVPAGSVVAPAPAPATADPQEKPQPMAQLPFSVSWALLIGIGIAFTPCILSMYPLISGTALGGKQRLLAGRTLLPAFIYVQGVVLTYTALGLVVTAADLQFQVALRHPYVLIGLAAISMLLALSTFGLSTLQLPSSLQTHLTLINNHQQSGSPDGAFAVGAITGLICSLRITALLSAILLYIAQSGNIWLGGSILYLYVLGMGLPLVLTAVFGNCLLPKSGPQMGHVRTAFSFAALALPVFLSECIANDEWGIRLWSLLAVVFFGWAFITSLQAKHAWMRIVQIVLLAAALVSVRPLRGQAFGTPHAQTQAHLNFTPVASVGALNQTLTRAKGRPVMLDLHVDWCVACKEFEKYTFSSPQVQQAPGNTVLLQTDVTANNAQDVALLEHLQVLGLPTILFFDAEGRGRPEARATGSMDTTTFSAHLRDRRP